MPGGDKTGPLGQGPLTGRRMGFCAGNENPGFSFNAGYRRRINQGYGAGMGRRRFRERDFEEKAFSEYKYERENSAKDNDLRNEIEKLKNQLTNLEKKITGSD